MGKGEGAGFEHVEDHAGGVDVPLEGLEKTQGRGGSGGTVKKRGER